MLRRIVLPTSITLQYARFLRYEIFIPINIHFSFILRNRSKPSLSVFYRLIYKIFSKTFNSIFLSNSLLENWETFGLAERKKSGFSRDTIDGGKSGVADSMRQNGGVSRVCSRIDTTLTRSPICLCDSDCNHDL